MISEPDNRNIGWQLGADGVSGVVEHVERYCACEERRIALTNKPGILSRKAELSLLFDDGRRIEEKLRHAPPPGDLRHHRRKAVYCWIVTALLTIAGFALTLLTFDPYRLGWKSYVYCLGIAVVTPFLVEKVLESCGTDKLFRSLVVIACASALLSLMLLAVIRGDLLATESSNAAPVVIFDNATPAPQPQDHFYSATTPLLRLAMLLLSLAMELGAGLALHKAWRMVPDTSEDWNKLRTDLSRIRQRMAALIEEITALENEGAVFSTRFWRDFYRSMLTQAARSAMTKLTVLLFAFSLFPHAHAVAQSRLNLVIAVDLTESVAVTGPDHQSDFRKNVEGVMQVLGKVPGGTHVTVLGITDHSFAQPYILLSATVPDDPGYFGERLNAARGELVRIWRLRSAQLQPHFRQTDILGALLLASQIFAQEPTAEKRVLVLFSDMRNSTSGLDLESSRAVAQLQGKRSIAREIPDLCGVQVFALGVDGVDRSISYWLRVKAFWSGYFQSAGADLERYSALRVFMLLSPSNSSHN